MSKVKRLLCLFIVLTFTVVSVFALSGCKSGGADATTIAEGTTQAPDPTEDFVELKWYVCQEAQTDHDEVMARVNEILKTKINASLDMQFLPWAAFEDKMALFFNSGDVFDLCYTCTWLKPFHFDAVDDGFLVALDDLIEQYGQTYKEEIPQFFWDAIQVDGKIYGLPNYQCVAAAPAFAMRKDLLEKYDLDITTLKTYEDMGKFFEVIKTNEPGIYPYVNQHYSNGYHLDWPKTVIEDPLMIDKDFKVSYVWDDPEMQRMYNINHDFYEKGYIPHDPNIMLNAMPNVAAGKVFCLQNVYKPGTEADFKKAHGVDMVYFRPYEAVRNGGEAAALTGISTTSKNPERAMMLMDLMMSDQELLNTVVYGIKDKHYKMTGASSIEALEAAKNYSMFAWQVGNQFLAYTLPGQPDTVWEDTKKMNNEAVPAITSGFTINKDPVKTESAAVGAVFEKYKSVIWSASLPFDEFAPQMKEEFMQAGLEELIAGVQQQIDEWKAANNK